VLSPAEAIRLLIREGDRWAVKSCVSEHRD